MSCLDLGTRKVLYAILAAVLILTLFQAAIFVNIKMVYGADGSVAAQEVYIEWYQPTWTGQGASTSAEYSIEDNNAATYMPEFNFTTLNVDYVNITQMRGYIEWQDTLEAFSRDWWFSVYEYTTDIDAGALVDYETFEMPNLDGSPLVRQWNTRTLSSQWKLTAGAYFFAIETEAQAGSVRLQGTTAGHTDSGRIVDRFDPPLNDPFDEDVSTANEEHSIQIKYWGYNDTLTTTNEYSGNATHYVARRDLNYSFPTGATSERIRITLPNAESLTNITKSGGGALTSSEYSTAALNATHIMITIPEDTINLYGGEYYVYSSSYVNLYTFHGLYYENGTFAENTQVTGYYPTGSTTSFWVNGTLLYGSATPLNKITWETAQEVRSIDFYETVGTYYLFTPEDTYGVYQFDIRDYSGRIARGNNYLESYRAVNGTWRLVERREFIGVFNAIPLVLTAYKIYELKVRFSDGSVFDYGYYYPDLDLSPLIAITQIAFSDQAHTTYEYITAEATRPNATHILVNYMDETPGYDTAELNLTVSYRNGTTVYTSVVAGSDTVSFNWYGANNETDYVAKLEVIHQLHNNIQQTWILDYSRTFQVFPDISDLGFGSVNLLPIAIGLVVAATCSFKSAALAPFMFMVVLSLFSVVGGANYTEVQLAVGWSFAIIVGLAIGDRS